MKIELNTMFLTEDVKSHQKQKKLLSKTLIKQKISLEAKVGK
jgi:hypothetical protein